MAEITPRIPYRKSYLSSDELCTKLENQGLLIMNVDQAKQKLERCSYYRFKAYLYPFKDSKNQCYKRDASFEQAVELYQFDSALRCYLFSIIEKVEIGVRSALDLWISQETGNLFWYLDSSLFNDNGAHIKTVASLRSMFIESKEEYSQHYRSKYYNEFCPFYRDLPPAWVALELMTFGNVLTVMKSFNQEAKQSLKLNRFVKRKLNIDKYESLCNWMEAIRQVRNVCGHHNRLFNRNFSSPSGIKRRLDSSIELVKTRSIYGRSEAEQLNRLYTCIVAIQIIHSGLGYHEKLGETISRLFDSYPTAKLFTQSMGFPAEWHNESLLF